MLVAAALIAGACGGGTEGDSGAPEEAEEATTTTAEPSTSTTTESTATTTSTTVAPLVSAVPTTEARVVLGGDEEMVFDWTSDRCEDEHIPDISARAIRNAEGLVQLYVSHYVTYRMVGSDLDSVVTDCTLTMASAFDPDPSRFDEAGWIAAPYTEDGTTVHAVIHNEYRGFVFDPADRCPLGDYLSCIDVTLTMAKSTDGGATFSHIAEPPDHLFASLPDVYIAEGEPSGLWQTSNLVAPGDGYHYLLTNINAYDIPTDARQWTCLLRSDDLDDPSSWRYWDGVGFDGVFVDPYRVEADREEICAPISRSSIGAEIMETVVYDDATGRYVALGASNDPATGGTWGVYYSFSEDLIDWSPRQLLLELPVNASVGDAGEELFYAYPAIIDPDSPSLNFDTTDGEAYLYIARLNEGGNSLDRDLVRWPIRIEEFELEAPVWTFDTPGDAEGWEPAVDLAPFTVADGVLSTSATGSDPHTVSGAFRMPGVPNPILSVRMRLDAPAATAVGQVFFVTESDPRWDEPKSTFFDIVADGEWRTYEIDMSTLPAWNAMVTNIRLDPGDFVDAAVEIDEIRFVGAGS